MCISGRVCTKSKKMSPVFLNVSVFSDGRHKGGQYFATENSMVGDEIVNETTKQRITAPNLLWQNMLKTITQLASNSRCRFCCGASKTVCC